MAFDEVHIRRRPAGRGVSRAHGPQLALAVGGQEVAAQIVGQADAADEPLDGVAVAQGIREALQDEDARAFAYHQPVAVRSNGAQRPEGDSARSWLNPTWVNRQSGRDTPPASMASARPERSSSQASFTA